MAVPLPGPAATGAFENGLKVGGTIGVTLYVSSDTRAFDLDETIQRVRYREGCDRQVFMELDEVYELEVSPMSTSNTFGPGHRLRIEISSSNFPRFTRNLNTGGRNCGEGGNGGERRNCRS